MKKENKNKLVVLAVVLMAIMIVLQLASLKVLYEISMGTEEDGVSLSPLSCSYAEMSDRSSCFDNHGLTEQEYEDGKDDSKGEFPYPEISDCLDDVDRDRRECDERRDYYKRYLEEYSSSTKKHGYDASIYEGDLRAYYVYRY